MATVHSRGIPTWKRALDLACLIFALPVLVPLVLIIGLWIKLLSQGPVLFRQERVGYHGRRFTCLKFRSMKAGADSNVHKNYLKELIHSEQQIGRASCRERVKIMVAN